MEALEIIVISCQEHETVHNRMNQVAWIGRAGQTCVGRRDHLVACLPEPRNEGGLGAVVIEVEIHALPGSAAGG